jgi:hypothetical protein
VIPFGEYAIFAVAGILAIMADHLLNQGRYWNQMLSWKDNHEKHELSPHARFRGQKGLTWWSLGDVVQMQTPVGAIPVERGRIETPTTSHTVDESGLFVPIAATFRWNMQDYDILTRDELLGASQNEIGRLKNELSVARGERDFVRQNFMDANSKLFVQIGEWRHHAGMTQTIFANKSGSGASFRTQAEPEGGGE